VTALRYAVVTPARNEAENLERLGASLAGQTVQPSRWVIVDNGSTDRTAEVAGDLASRHGWIEVVQSEALPGLVRGGPIVRAFHRGLVELDDDVDVVIKLDADTSFEPDYHERLLAAFADQLDLGMASGSAWEREDDGAWRQRHMTGDHVWGAARAYRRACLDDVLPLEESMGWDGIDALKAGLAGWKTRTLVDLPFFHHRAEGERDGARRRAWAAQGKASWFMGYRFWYLAARAFHHARREPAALALVSGFLGAALRRDPRCDDASVRAHLRREQSLWKLPVRMREAAGRRSR
jgi:glycosyltransferase involved in cell wall biosynthesis